VSLRNLGGRKINVKVAGDTWDRHRLQPSPEIKKRGTLTGLIKRTWRGLEKRENHRDSRISLNSTRTGGIHQDNVYGRIELGKKRGDKGAQINRRSTWTK